MSELKRIVAELKEALKLAAEYQGKDVKLNKPTKGDTKKYKVYVKDPKTDNVKKVEFGDPNLEIKRDDPDRRKNFRSRHKCDTDPKAKDKTRPKYWSCRFWEGGKTVTELLNKKSSMLAELRSVERKLVAIRPFRIASKALEELSVGELIRKVHKELGYSEEEMSGLSKKDLIEVLRDNGIS